LKPWAESICRLGVNSIPAKFNTLNYCICPLENKDLFLQGWDGMKSTFLAVFRDWKCCHMSYAHCKVCPLVSHFLNVKAVDEAVKEEDLIQQAE
jgi:hypothetical protein